MSARVAAAMNSARDGAARARCAPRVARPARAGAAARRRAARRLVASATRVAPRHVLVLAFVLAYPFVASPFFTFQIGAQSLALGLIALSLTFLGGYGGMVSLAQMTVAGIAGYCVAIFGTSSIARDQPRLAVVAGGAVRAARSRRSSPPPSAGSRCAPRASTRS